jgi:diguanylate cyclase (GGDEF)-like protein
MVSIENESEIVDIMTEAELYIKYQCYPQAREILEDVMAKFPRYLPAKEALKTIFHKTGKIDKANEIAREISLISEQLATQRSVTQGKAGTGDQLQRRQLVEKIDKIIKEIYDSNHLNEILKISAFKLVENLHADRCLIITLSKDKGQAKSYEYCKEGILSSLDSKTAKLNILLLKKVAGGFDPVIIDETMKDPSLAECRPLLEQFKIQSVMAYPLVYKSSLIGLIVIHRCSKPVQWSEQERTLFSTVTGHIAVAISNAQQFSEIQTLANTDKLTGLYNRRFFEERLSAELRNAQQQRYPLSLALLDIDHFKKINDTQGHNAGDKALHKLGFLLKTNLRKGDVVARFGGEEFVIILPNTHLETAHRIMDNLRSLVEKTIATESGSPMTISVGVMEAALMGQEELADVQRQIIQKADEHLYCAKRSGRNRVCSQIDPDMETKNDHLKS